MATSEHSSEETSGGLALPSSQVTEGISEESTQPAEPQISAGSDGADMVRQLRQALPALWCLLVVFGLLTLLLLRTIVSIVRTSANAGVPWWGESALREVLIDDSLKAVVLGSLSFALWGVIRAIRKDGAGSEQLNEPGQLKAYVQATKTWWNRLAIGFTVIVLYTVYTTYLVYSASPTPRQFIEKHFAAPAGKQLVDFELRLAESSPGEGLSEVAVLAHVYSERVLYLHPEPFLTNADILYVRAYPGDDSDYVVYIEFVPSVHEKVEKITSEHMDRPIALLLNGEIVIASNIDEPMSNSVVIRNSMTWEEAEKIVKGIAGKQ